MTPEEKTFVTADEREFTFLFDLDGLIAAEDCANRGSEGNAGLKQIIAGAARGRLGYLVGLVVGGLRAHHPDISRAGAFELIDSDGKALGAALWPALFAAMPDAKAEGGTGANPRTAASGTGTRSSPRGSKKGSTKRVSASRPRAATRSS